MGEEGRPRQRLVRGGEKNVVERCKVKGPCGSKGSRVDGGGREVVVEWRGDG